MNLLSFFGPATEPDPSLCDTCQHAYKLGGAVCVGNHSYDQRYCDKLTIAIHMGGKQECEHYMVRTVQS